MTWSKSTTFDLHQIIEKGFPVDPKFHETLKGDQGYELTLDLEFESLGYPSNGWDDPGSGPEFYIDEVYFEDPPLEGFLPLSDTQLSWLENHIAMHEAAGMARDIADWLSEPDFDRDYD